ncbi:MAG TPA: hypothetical protein DHW71_13845 [Gammaproteobacteria bacterium]|nr:hypothetical protein [Gammaproteobacteria bacterium]HBF07367.1 hypothetical protein [Gammaproteobacteria bacterium]HCK94073.1 hypothetical protein [Gammaproteobacteria bacterium]|tara:strand:- start:51663 stop:53531 length:1869 start_codon:yes stop_codon:yes gene_type:complete
MNKAWQDSIKVIKSQTPVLIMFIMVAMAIITTLWLGINTARNEIKSQDQAQALINTELNRIEQEIAQRLGDNAISLYIVGHSPVLRRYAEDSQEYFTDLQTLFYSLIKSSPDIYQMRFIDQNGMEKIRVEDVNNQLQFTPQDQLQNKHSRDYFIEAKQTAIEKIYVGKIDLNIENGKVEEPWEPTIRLAMPIYTQKSLFSGILVINIHADWIFDKYLTSTLPEEYNFKAVNKEGYWLAGKPIAELWGFMFNDNEDHRISQTYPETWSQLNQKTQASTFINNNRIWTQDTIQVRDIFPKSIEYSNPDEVLWHSIVDRPAHTLLDTLSSLTPYFAIALVLLGIAISLIKVIQDKMNTENELIKSERLSSLGGLVAGVAHELNTPIGSAITTASTINAYALEIRETIENGQIKKSKIYEFTKDMEYAGQAILSGLNRADLLISQFKQIAVDQAGEQKRAFQLDEYITEMSGTFAHLFKHKKVQLRLRLGSKAKMNSYPGALSQVIINLVQNALIHGFDEHETGTITVKTENLGNNKVLLKVIDTGKGIKPDIINKIFDPFFTTRLGQGGSGLGLHITHNIVNNILLGQLKVDSDQGKRLTEFSLVLPTEITQATTEENAHDRPAA